MPTNPSPFARVTLLAASLLALALTACAGETPPPKPPVRELSAPATNLLALAPATFGSQAPIALPDDHGSAAAQAAFAALAGTSAVHEPALDLVAAAVGKTYAEAEELPADALLQWLYWRCGAISLPGPVNVLVAPADAEPYFQEHLRRLAAVVPGSGMTLSFGIARISIMGYVAQTVAIGFRLVDVAPVAKSQAPGATVPVRIRPRKPYADLTLFVDQGGAGVLSQPMKQEADGSYSAEAPLPATPGRYFVEVAGIDLPPDGAVEKGWRMSLLWLPLHAGVTETSAPDDFIRRPKKNHRDRGAWPFQILTAYNDERARLGRAPLTFEASASQLAQRQSEEYAGVAGLPPPELGLSKKLADAGLPARNIFGYVDEIEFVSEYITLRLLRPAARFALLNPAMTTLAVGLTPRRVAPGLGLLSSVEYVLEHIRIDPPKERAHILDTLDAVETDAGGKAYTRSDPLTSAAQAVVDEVCRGGPMPTSAQQIFARVAGLDPSLRNRAAVPWSGYDLSKEEVARAHKEVKGQGYTHAGVGVCQGTVEGHPGAVMMLVLFAGP